MNIYGSKLLKFPMPQYVVFCNGPRAEDFAEGRTVIISMIRRSWTVKKKGVQF